VHLRGYHKEAEGLQARDHQADPLGDRQVGRRHLRRLRRRRLRRLLLTHHPARLQSPQFPLYQRLHTKRSPMSRHQRTLLRQKSGTVFDDKPSFTSRKIDETLTMTKRSFDSC
jgi:hypothetical protein